MPCLHHTNTGLHDEPLGKAAFDALRATARAAKQEQQQAAQLEQQWAAEQAAAAAADANRSAAKVVAAERPEDSDSDSDDEAASNRDASPAASPPRTAAAAADSASAIPAAAAQDAAAAERAAAEAAEAVVVENERAAAAAAEAQQAEAQRRLAAEAPELHTLKKMLHTLAAPVLEAALLSPEARMQLVAQQVPPAAAAAAAAAAAVTTDHATAAAFRALAAVRALADERVPSYPLPLPALPTVAAEGDAPPPANGRSKRLRWAALSDTDLDALLLTLHKPLSNAAAAAQAAAGAAAAAAAAAEGEQGGAAGAAGNEAGVAVAAAVRESRITALKTLPLWRTLTGERVALSAAPYRVLGHDVGEGLPLPDSAKSMLLVKMPHLQDMYRDLEVSCMM
jgi:hypothetical protein